MPTLNWVGKSKVVNHHHDVPFRLLDKQYSFTANDCSPENSTDNCIIHGDNLEAIKSLLTEFEGKVNCIYIDAAYNTGNEGWVYNGAVNDPQVREWLRPVVNKEGQDQRCCNGVKPIGILQDNPHKKAPQGGFGLDRGDNHL